MGDGLRETGEADGHRARTRDQEIEPTHEEAGVLREVLRALRRVRHGHVQIIIQDAKVVQIDRTEKVRLVK